MPDPMYRRIADDLRVKIESGELSQGTQLPTEIELRERYGNASRNTVRDAVKWLIIRGLVETRPGQGTFVTKRVEPFVTSLLTVPQTLPVGLETGLGGEGVAYVAEVTAHGRRPEYSVPRVEIQQARGLVQAALQLDSNSQVVCRHQERRIDGTPYSLQTTFYPMELVQQGAARLLTVEDILPGVMAYLEHELGINQAGWRDTITVRNADAHETAFFRLPEDWRVPVFETHRTGYDESGRPLRLTVSTYPTDRNQFVMDVGKVPHKLDAVPGEGGVVTASETGGRSTG